VDLKNVSHNVRLVVVREEVVSLVCRMKCLFFVLWLTRLFVRTALSRGTFCLEVLKNPPRESLFQHFRYQPHLHVSFSLLTLQAATHALLALFDQLGLFGNFPLDLFLEAF